MKESDFTAKLILIDEIDSEEKWELWHLLNMDGIFMGRWFILTHPKSHPDAPVSRGIYFEPEFQGYQPLLKMTFAQLLVKKVAMMKMEVINVREARCNTKSKALFARTSGNGWTSIC